MHAYLEGINAVFLQPLQVVDSSIAAHNALKKQKGSKSLEIKRQAGWDIIKKLRTKYMEERKKQWRKTILAYCNTTTYPLPAMMA